MNTKTLAPQALEVIDSYRRFQVGSAITSVPYFNNKTVGTRFGERTRVGKGSAKDIHAELDIILAKAHIDAGVLNDESLKKLLVENNLGIDCSAFAYYILEAENKERGQGHLNRHLTFIKGGNPVTKMISYLRPVQNCDVKTFASDINSRVIPVNHAQPGDFMTLLAGPTGSERNHILAIQEVAYENDAPKAIFYSHIISYPNDGLYGSGVKQGKIEMTFPNKALTEQIWTEDGSPQKASIIFERAHNSQTELRRLKWLS